MLKNYLAFFLAICLLGGLFVAPPVHRHGFDAGVAFLKHGNPLLLTAWDHGAGDYAVFRGLKYELVRIEFHDGAVFQFTSLAEHKVTFQAPVVQRLVEKLFHRTMADIAVVVHNHPTLPDFSPADMEVLGQLRALGFGGEFLLWHKGDLTAAP